MGEAIGLQENFSVIFQYLYHSLIFFNEEREKEGECLFNLAIKRIKEVKKLKEEGKVQKLYLTKKITLYSLGEKDKLKKMLLDDLSTELLFLNENKNTKKEDFDRIKELKSLLKKT